MQSVLRENKQIEKAPPSQMSFGFTGGHLSAFSVASRFPHFLTPSPHPFSLTPTEI